jgi:hypothetical protein
MAVFIKTDAPPGAPGTASFSSTTVAPGASSTSLTLYYTDYYAGSGSEITLASLQISLSKKSLVAILAISHSRIVTPSGAYHRIYVGTTKLVEEYYSADDALKLRVLKTYAVLNPGTYTISYRFYAVPPYGSDFWIYTSSGNPAIRLEAVIVPLE